MNTTQKNLVFILVSIFALFSTANTNAATVIPSNYMVAGDIGDTWTYAALDNTQFTLTLSEITSGTNAGRFKFGNDDLSTIYDVTNNVLTVYEYFNYIANPPVVFSEIELGQVVTLNDDPINPSQYLLWDLPSITVQAGTFNDVLAVVWLDDNPLYSPNIANTELGLNSSVTEAVTDIDYYVRGVGFVKFQGIDASTGLSDGFGLELVSTTVVPIPAALPLFLSGLFCVSFLSRNKTKKIT